MTRLPTQPEEPKDSHPRDVRDRENVDSGSVEDGSDVQNGEAPFEGPKGDPAEGKRR
jgi:hypothetical protein